MVRNARFAFDDPRGPDRASLHDLFDEGDDPLFDRLLLQSDDLPSERGPTDSSQSRSTPENTTPTAPRNRAAECHNEAELTRQPNS